MNPNGNRYDGRSKWSWLLYLVAAALTLTAALIRYLSDGEIHWILIATGVGLIVFGLVALRRNSVRRQPGPVKQTLSEDAADLEAFEKRRREPSSDFEDVVRAMKRSGKL